MSTVQSRGHFIIAFFQNDSTLCQIDKTSQHSTIYPYICKLSPLGTETLGASSILLPQFQLWVGVDGLGSRQPKESQCLIHCRGVVSRIALCSLGEPQVSEGCLVSCSLCRNEPICMTGTLTQGMVLCASSFLPDCLPSGWCAGPCSTLPYCISITFLDSLCSVLFLAEHNPLMALCL